MKSFIIGITGPAGSLKRNLLEHLASCGGSTINGDEVAKRIIYTDMNKGTLVDLLGNTALNTQGEYDFKEIRRIFFTDPHKRTLTENYFSNEIWKEIERLIEESGGLFVTIKNSVLFEQGWGNRFNLIVCLYCDEEESIRRVTSVGKLSLEEIQNILACQMPTKTKIELSDISINTTNFDESEGNRIAEIILRKIEEKYMRKPSRK